MSGAMQTEPCPPYSAAHRNSEWEITHSIKPADYTTFSPLYKRARASSLWRFHDHTHSHHNR